MMWDSVQQKKVHQAKIAGLRSRRPRGRLRPRDIIVLWCPQRPPPCAGSRTRLRPVWARATGLHALCTHDVDIIGLWCSSGELTLTDAGLAQPANGDDLSYTLWGAMASKRWGPCAAPYRMCINCGQHLGQGNPRGQIGRQDLQSTQTSSSEVCGQSTGPPAPPVWAPNSPRHASTACICLSSAWLLSSIS